MADNTQLKVDTVKTTAAALDKLQEDTGVRLPPQVVQQIITERVQSVAPKQNKE